MEFALQPANRRKDSLQLTDLDIEILAHDTHVSGVLLTARFVYKTHVRPVATFLLHAARLRNVLARIVRLDNPQIQD